MMKLVKTDTGLHYVLYYILIWLLSTILLLMGTNVMAQDPAQYGTPFSGVPYRMDANIYQLNLREYSASRDIAGARQKLQRIKDLGINVIYLMPIYPLGVTNNPDGSPYSHKDLKSVASDLGTLSDLRGLVDDAHNLGMAVILDFVANQTAWDHPWITQHPDWYHTDGNGNIISPTAGSLTFSDVAWLDLDNSAAAAAMVDAMRYWVFAANIDGFRFDWADKAPPAFWTNTISNLRGISTHDLLLLAEGSNEGTNSGCTTCELNQPGYHYSQGFDYIFGTNFYWNVMKKVWNSGEPVTNLDGVTTGEYSGASSSQMVARFLSDHDDYNADGSPFSFMNGKAAVMSAFVVIAYQRGVPFVYNGIEVGNTNPLPYPWSSDNINWTQDLTVYTEMQKILNFRNASTAIKRGQPTSYIDPANTNPDIIAFTKSSGSEKVAVMVNVRNSSKSFTIPSGMAGNYVDAYSGANVTLTSGATQNLGAYEYIVLTNASVPVVDVTGVALTPTSATINEGLTTLLSASVAPSNASNQNVTWSSSNTAVATVSATGLVTGVSAGTATITVTTEDGGFTSSSTITVNPAPHFTVHFYRPSTWGTGINIYWWSAQPSGVLADGSWPGVTMTSEGSDWYSYTFTNVTSTNLIFNDGTNQTADLSRNGTDGWYQNGAWYDTNPGVCDPSTITPYVSINSGSWNQTASANLDAGGSVSFGPQPATGGSWSWSGPNSYSDTTREITLSNVSVSQSGTYTASYTNSCGTISTQDFSLTVNSLGQTPYNGVISLPGTIEFENYDSGGEGVAYHDNDAGNNGGQYRSDDVDIESCSEGGYNIGWTDSGEWLEYTVDVSTAGNYDLTIRAAGAVGGSLYISFDGTDVTGTVTIPNTGGWQTWQDVTVSAVALNAGQQVVRVYMNSGGFNLNNLTISTSSTSGGGGSVYRIKNRWQGTYLYDNGNQAAYGTPSASDQTSQWTLEAVDGYTAIKNVGTGDYLNIENLQSYVECTNVPTTYYSAQWAMEDYDGYKRIRNRWQSGDYIHIEDLLGYAEHGSISAGAYSSQWALETVSGARLAEESSAKSSIESAEISIFPNPVKDKVNLKVSGLEDKSLSIEIIDLSGRTMMQKSALSIHDGLDVSQLESGVYLIKVETAGFSKTMRMIKSK